ncbi:MAG: hypothetical protein VR72_15550 [Clostridiaceae bacterium BRH_c20a]|nr:MAG: hypothetical protein VR72_15550 [Clostridiaceae bacterium BRH_c20a]
MNKEKYSKILDKYSDSLKKYGVYLLIILFFLTFSLNYLLGRMKDNSMVINSDSFSEPEILIEEVGNNGSEEKLAVEIDSEQQKTETAVTTVANTPQKPEPQQAEKPAENITQKPAEDTSPIINTETRPLDLIWPVKGDIINNFGISYSKKYDDYRLHPGLNIRTNPGVDINAAFEGKITMVENTEAEKFIIEIDHGKGWLSRYSQLAQAVVKEGQTVKAGEKIGQAGAPGTEGVEESHLHFRIKQNDQWSDPLEYLKK